MLGLIQPVDCTQKLLGGGRVGKLDLFRMHAEVFAGAGLVAHVQVGGRVVTHQDRSQTGDQVLPLQFAQFLSHFGLDLFGYFFPVQHSCLHGSVQPGLCIKCLLHRRRLHLSEVKKTSVLTALRSVGLLDVLHEYGCGGLGRDALSAEGQPAALQFGPRNKETLVGSVVPSLRDGKMAANGVAAYIGLFLERPAPSPLRYDTLCIIRAPVKALS